MGKQEMNVQENGLKATYDADSTDRSLGSSALHRSVLPRGHRGQDPLDLTPHRHEHMGFIKKLQPIYF